MQQCVSVLLFRRVSSSDPYFADFDGCHRWRGRADLPVAGLKRRSYPCMHREVVCTLAMRFADLLIRLECSQCSQTLLDLVLPPDGFRALPHLRRASRYKAVLNGLFIHRSVSDQPPPPIRRLESTRCCVANRRLAPDSPRFCYFASTSARFCRATLPYALSPRPLLSTLALTLPTVDTSPHLASPSLLLDARSRRSPIAFGILFATLCALTYSPTRPCLRIAISRRTSASFRPASQPLPRSSAASLTLVHSPIHADRHRGH
jgi:hypothetical protein